MNNQHFKHAVQSALDGLAAAAMTIGRAAPSSGAGFDQSFATIDEAMNSLTAITQVYEQRIMDTLNAMVSTALETWLPMDTAPAGVDVLIRFENDRGWQRVWTGILVLERAVEVDDWYVNYDDDHSSEQSPYDVRWLESDDIIFMKAGWYVTSWPDDEESAYYTARVTPTGWRPLPKAKEVTA